MRLLLFLIGAVAVAHARDSYVIVVPKDVRPGASLNISVNILHAAGDVDVTAELQVKSTQKSLAKTHGMFQQGGPGTLTLQIPGDLGSGSYKLVVHGSRGLIFRNETDLHYQAKSMSVFIQTDKAMYKPGQTVHYRAFAMYPNLTVYTGEMDIEIYDPNSNKIKQLLNVKDASGVLTNFMNMDSQPVLGDWKIKVTAHGKSAEKAFTVAHYVLPKFEVTVELPPFGLTSDDNIKGTVKAMYTYGKPVEGTLTIHTKLENWYRPWNYHDDEPMVKQTMQINGEAKITIPIATLKAAQHYLNGHKIVVEANVTESLTQMTLGGSSKLTFHDHMEKIEFLSSNPNTFKPGLPYTAYVRVSQQDDRPITGTRQSLKLQTTVTYEYPEPATTPLYYWGPRTGNYKLKDHTFTVPDTGVIPVQITIPENATNINLHATYGPVSAYKSLSKSYSPSDSYVQLFLKSSSLRAGSDAHFDVKSTQPVSKVVYQVLSRGAIAKTGTIDGGNAKTFTFAIPVTSKMAPNARIVVYYVRADGEIVTDSISFDVEGVFQNQVSISFDKTKAQPGDGVNVQVTADPQSLVNLLAVDQSVLLLKSGNDITQDEVVDELKSYDTISHSDGGYPVLFNGPIALGQGRRKRMIWWPYATYYGGSDAQQIFSNAGVKVLTDATVYHHKERYPGYYGCPMCGMPMPVPGIAVNGALAGGGTGAMAPPGGAFSGTSSHTTALKEVEKIRKTFPETWLWSNATTGANGQVNIATTVPDTITSWVASAFAVNRVSGLGIAENTAKIEAFRPFFVSLNLPYSVVRGEEVVLQANVFNYMSSDMDVLVTLSKNDDFRSIVVNAQGVTHYLTTDQTNTVHVEAGKSKSVFFPIVPAEIGNVDITVKAQSTLAADGVKRSLLVEPEGVPKEYNTPILVDLKQKSTFSKTVPITLPAGVVAGSQHVRISAIGDLMGPTVNGLDKLLRMPTGCGEQTMLGFAPDVFVTNYLTATNQLSSDIEEKAIGFMEKGYQRELTFQHKDGSFSAFGDSDKSGSMWLTAFVAKSFHQAKQQIFIDDETLTRALDWMISRQNASGAFPEPGRVIHKDMQGGSASGPGLTAFVLIALMENNDLKGGIQQRIHTAAEKAKTYLESSVATITDDYVLSIVGYALTLAKSQAASSTMAKLENDAIVQDGVKHWHKAQQKTTSHHYWSPPHKQSNPIDIEMTSYALLVYAENNQFATGIPIMKWITSQRNPQGGFSSTQDTVLALQALSEFARLAYSNNFDIQMTVTAGSFSHQFSINAKNALLLQTVELPSIPSSVSVSATGHGMGLLEVAVFFNVEQEIEEPSFDVTVTITEETMNSLKIQTCSHWLQTGASGMAVQEIGVPTGFEADLESIPKIGTLKKTETENRKVILYFDEIAATPTCLTMDMVRSGLVAKSQPAPVRVYDYYEPDNQVTKFYQSQLLKDSSICDVCPQCGCPASGSGQ